MIYTVVLLFDHLFDFLGAVYFGLTVYKIAKGYPITRWFI